MIRVADMDSSLSKAVEDVLQNRRGEGHRGHSTGPSCAVCIGELEIHHEYRRGRKVRLNHGEYAISYCMAGAFE